MATVFARGRCLSLCMWTFMITRFCHFELPSDQRRGADHRLKRVSFKQWLIWSHKCVERTPKKRGKTVFHAESLKCCLFWLFYNSFHGTDARCWRLKLNNISKTFSFVNFYNLFHTRTEQRCKSKQGNATIPSLSHNVSIFLIPGSSPLF